MSLYFHNHKKDKPSVSSRICKNLSLHLYRHIQVTYKSRILITLINTKTLITWKPTLTMCQNSKLQCIEHLFKPTQVFLQKEWFPSSHIKLTERANGKANAFCLCDSKSKSVSVLFAVSTLLLWRNTLTTVITDAVAFLSLSTVEFHILPHPILVLLAFSTLSPFISSPICFSVTFLPTWLHFFFSWLSSPPCDS